jgi:hypothetical protein
MVFLYLYMPSDFTAVQVLTVWYIRFKYVTPLRGNRLLFPLNESSVFCVLSILILSIPIGYVSYHFLKSLFLLFESYLCLPLRTAVSVL